MRQQVESQGRCVPIGGKRDGVERLPQLDGALVTSTQMNP